MNPPLVRTIAALPVVCCRPQTDWSEYRKRATGASPESRPEWSEGIRFVRKNRDRAQWFFAWARWTCIPLSLIGGYFCWRWAGELYGDLGGAMALVMWCVSPNILAWSATICPDVAAAALGVAAGYCFWRWLRDPDWSNALTAGIALGLALLTKMTWILLLAVWPFVWLAWVWAGRRDVSHVAGRKQALRLAGVLAVGLFVLNLGYGFEGTFTKLGEFTFASRSLAEADSTVDGGWGGNRFAESWLANVPVPLPRNYVRGIDLQKADFERALPSYLFEEWKARGWWYYYLVCAVLKVPLGTWVLGLLAVGVRVGGLKPVITNRLESAAKQAKPAACSVGWRDEVVLLLPALVLVVLVSSQTGISRHFRYLLPAFPFLFIWISKVACVAGRRPRTVGVLATGALVWLAASSLWIYPHSMSYFNEVVGGPSVGHRYLLDANIDWGQDVFYLREWCRKHPESGPVYVLFRNSFSDDLLGIDNNGKPPMGPASASQGQSRDTCETRDLGPWPGWYATSVHRMHDEGGHYLYFLRYEPVAMAGYSIYIYHITLDDANRARHELGLPELEPEHAKNASKPGETGSGH
ncbi:MAG: glycosyltransferase family 39 protein [Planctomycetes bacterium]|nr:glycosyltransferase family 39 protein [Planctomycetota bacterium]